MQFRIKPEYKDQLRYQRPDALVETQCSMCRCTIDDDVVPTQVWDMDGYCVTLCDACAGKAIEVRQ